MQKLIVSVLVLSCGLANAATHEINLPPIRSFLEKTVLDKKTGKLQLKTKLNYAKPPKGVSAQAAEKAHETWVGLTDFNSGSTGATYIRNMGKSKVLITAVKAHDPADYTKYIQRFVVRTDKEGVVSARGHVANGVITYTRSHNEHADTTDAETNAAK